MTLPAQDTADVTASSTPDPAAELQNRVDRLLGAPCVDCGQQLCGHQALFSIAMGVADRPRCLWCLARSLEREADELRDGLLQHFRHRDCYHQVWNAVTARERRQSAEFSHCPWPEAATLGSICANVMPVTPTSESPRPGAARDEGTHGAIEWDAGEMACGELIMQLRLRLRSLSPGAVLRLIARDRGAVEDIPAWCRLTGHRLLSADHPCYGIERKPE